MSAPKQRISAAKLKETIARSIKDGDFTLPAVAVRLQLSPRSLQRQLSILSITYSELVDEVRQETAKLLLATSTLGIAQVAAALGYRDPSSFSRAFMRWSQVSPRHYRASFRTKLF
jgi:AraC-like DNA-binding protein